MTSTHLGLLASLTLFAGASWPKLSSADQPIEMGTVRWNRDYEAAMLLARETDRPLFVQFQEIPGCATCQRYGTGPLSHPLIVEALETEFVPVLIYNNRGGTDAALLKRFSETAWNNPVSRYLDANGKDLIPRRPGIWSTTGVAQQMVAALEAAKRTVPNYLFGVAATDSSRLERATFAMGCFWEGESLLGSINGVVATHVGWWDGREVVDLLFDPQQADYRTLVETARTMKCTSKVFTRSPAQLRIAQQLVGEQAVSIDPQAVVRNASLSDQKYYLRRSPLIHAPLTPFQATKLNSALRLKQPIAIWLSPRQTELVQQIAATTRRTPGSLDQFEVPSEESELAVYWQKLSEHLAELPKGQAASD